MARGVVKWFNPMKGYGFIQPQGGGRDVFLHISAVARAGLSTLDEGQSIDYEVDLACSLIPGLDSSSPVNILAGSRVLSAVGACPLHDGVR
jgi:cold shock protein